MKITFANFSTCRCLRDLICMAKPTFSVSRNAIKMFFFFFFKKKDFDVHFKMTAIMLTDFNEFL